MEFPFLWGAATSSHQIEGYNDKNDWWAWEAEGRIEGGARSGAATDHRHRFREDLKLAADLGLNSYRFSIEWSRIEPEEQRWDNEAFDWYLELVAECERLRLLPMITLHHFTSPKWFADQGGFASPNSPTKFAKFVAEVTNRLGSRIPLWCTFNEPMVLATGAYLGKFMPPAEFSPKKVSRACQMLLKSHVAAYRILHSKISKREGPWKDHPIQVGIAHNMLDFIPDRFWHPIEHVVARVLNRFYNRSWLDAVTGRKQHFGIPRFVPYSDPVSEALGHCTSDFIGINYYTKAYVQWRPRDAIEEQPAESPIGLLFARKKEPCSDLGWAIHSQGLKKVLQSVASYGLPIYITENGIADRDDRLRPDFLVLHLKETAKAIQNGIDIRGYYHWSLLDNFEWIKGFGPRFGLFSVNYESFERTPTATATLYQKIIEDHRSNADLKPRLGLL